MASSVTWGTTKDGLSYISCGQENSNIALVCVHGWACRGTDFSYVFSEFCKDQVEFRAIALDLPGHGTSLTQAYPVAGVSTFANAVLGLIDELAIPNVVLVGHSMGVRIILKAWEQASVAGTPVVRGLCFLDGSHYKFRKSLFSFDSGDARSVSLSLEQKHEAMGESFRRMFSSRTPVDFQEATVAHVKTIDIDYNSAMRKSFIQYDYDHTDDALAALGKAGLPVMSLQATDVDEANQRRMLREGESSRWMEFVREKVPQVRLVIVKDSMHFPHVDQPECVERQLREFVEGLS